MNSKVKEVVEAEGEVIVTDNGRPRYKLVLYTRLPCQERPPITWRGCVDITVRSQRQRRSPCMKKSWRTLDDLRRPSALLKLYTHPNRQNSIWQSEPAPLAADIMAASSCQRHLSCRFRHDLTPSNGGRPRVLRRGLCGWPLHSGRPSLACGPSACSGPQSPSHARFGVSFTGRSACRQCPGTSSQTLSYIRQPSAETRASDRNESSFFSEAVNPRLPCN